MDIQGVPLYIEKQGGPLHIDIQGVPHHIDIQGVPLNIDIQDVPLYTTYRMFHFVWTYRVSHYILTYRVSHIIWTVKSFKFWFPRVIRNLESFNKLVGKLACRKKQAITTSILCVFLRNFRKSETTKISQFSAKFKKLHFILNLKNYICLHLALLKVWGQIWWMGSE